MQDLSINQDLTHRFSDGRMLSFRVYGQANGKPVFYFHGWPGSRLEGGLFHEAALQYGIQLIAPERPGYGCSTAAPDYRLQDWAADVGLLADALKLGSFGVMGMSGGGPHAAAVISLLADRITRCALVVPMGPMDAPGGLKHMLPHQRMMVWLAKRLPGLARSLMYVPHWGVRLIPGWTLKIFMRMGLSAPDVATLTQVESDGTFMKSMQEALRPGVDGIFGDGMRFLHPWNLDLGRITCPVHLWHGDADRIVPMPFGKQLASQIPGCETTWLPGEGHFSVAMKYPPAFFAFLAGA